MAQRQQHRRHVPAVVAVLMVATALSLGALFASAALMHPAPPRLANLIRS
jgi:hypothetical protein